MKRLKKVNFSLEKILTFFPNEVKIDAFKKEICNSLNIYNNDIKAILSEMTEQSNDLKVIRENIKQMNNKYHCVSPTSVCDYCNTTVLPKSFFLFPCQHMFHLDCIKNIYQNYSPKTKRKVFEKFLKDNTRK